MISRNLHFYSMINTLAACAEKAVSASGLSKRVSYMTVVSFNKLNSKWKPRPGIEGTVLLKAF